MQPVCFLAFLVEGEMMEGIPADEKTPVEIWLTQAEWEAFERFLASVRPSEQSQSLACQTVLSVHSQVQAILED